MIKMRTNKDTNAQCCECGNDRSKSLEMFDVSIGGRILTICDLCNGQLLNKTLHADVKVNTKLKRPEDMEIIRQRKASGRSRW